MNLLNQLRWVAGAFIGTLTWSPTENRSIALPDGEGTLVLDNSAIRGYRPLVAVSAPKTLSLSDANTYQLCTAATVITIPLNVTAAFATGTEIIVQRGTNDTVTINGVGGVSIIDETGASASLLTVYNEATLKKLGANTWSITHPIGNSVFLPGTPTTITPSTVNNSQALATTAHVKSNLASYAPLASPSLTGSPTAPTPATSDNSTLVATTAHVKSNLASYAPLASPALTGTPTAPTPSTSDNSTKLATTAYVNSVNAVTPGLLVYATQPTTVTSNGVLVSLPFPTQPLFTSALFSSGIFTPTVTGLYRIAVKMARLDPSNSTAVQYSQISIYQGTTALAFVDATFVYGNSATPYATCGTADIQLTANTAYNIKGLYSGQFYAGTGVVNSLTIHRLY